jgi:glycine cleavage system H protein
MFGEIALVIVEGSYRKYEMPLELFYHKDHVWARVEPDGNVRVGLDDFLLKNLAHIAFVHLSPLGKKIIRNQPFGSMESKKYVGPLPAPVSGEIVEVNRRAYEVFKEDPYDRGWLILVKPANLAADLANLISGEAILAWIKREIEEREIIS